MWMLHGGTWLTPPAEPVLLSSPSERFASGRAGQGMDQQLVCLSVL